MTSPTVKRGQLVQQTEPNCSSVPELEQLTLPQYCSQILRELGILSLNSHGVRETPRSVPMATWSTPNFFAT